MSAALDRSRPAPVETAEEQIRRLDHLIRTTPPGSPSVVMLFLPETARHTLDNRNKDNRPRRSAKISEFSEALLAGGFPLTGDTLKFSPDGRLIDGQNRLAAVVKSGVPLLTHVVFGLPYDIFHVLDSGAGRTAGDDFDVAKIPHPTVASKAVRWLMIFDDKLPYTRGSAFPHRKLFDHYKESLNTAALEAQVRRVKTIDRTLPPGQLAALLYLFELKDPATNLTFVGDLQQRRRSARLLLDELDRLRRHAGNRVHESIVAALVIQTWNAYRSGKPVRASQIKWLDEKSRPAID